MRGLIFRLLFCTFIWAISWYMWTDALNASRTMHPVLAEALIWISTVFCAMIAVMGFFLAFVLEW